MRDYKAVEKDRAKKDFISRQKDFAQYSEVELRENIQNLTWFLSENGREAFEQRVTFLFNGDYGCGEMEMARDYLGDHKKVFELLCALEFYVPSATAFKLYDQNAETISSVIAAVNPPITKKTVLDEVLLSDEGRAIHLPNTRIPREVYMEVKQALELIGGKWNTGKQCFLFKESAAQYLEKLREGVHRG